MPQLMPFYWVNSVMMVFYIVVCLLFLYFYKKMEMMNMLQYKSYTVNKEVVIFKILW